MYNNKEEDRKRFFFFFKEMIPQEKYNIMKNVYEIIYKYEKIARE